MCDVPCWRCCCSNCCCSLACSLPAEPRHPCLTLFSNMQLRWQVREFPLKLPALVVQHPTVPALLPASLLPGLRLDDDTRSNRRALSPWASEALILVSLLHSGTARSSDRRKGLSQESGGGLQGGALTGSHHGGSRHRLLFLSDPRSARTHDCSADPLIFLTRLRLQLCSGLRGFRLSGTVSRLRGGNYIITWTTESEHSSEGVSQICALGISE